MSVWILLFILAFTSGLATHKTSGTQSPSARSARLCVAAVFALLFFGYVIGKDLAIRDNHRSTSSVHEGTASVAITSISNHATSH
ncbi:MAG: hypothetical protein ABIP02_10035 [Arenimonas sp.]